MAVTIRDMTQPHPMTDPARKQHVLPTEALLPLVYDQLRTLAAHRLASEHSGQLLQPSALVHEAYLRLVQCGHQRTWDSKGHFFSAAAEAMRRILIEEARKNRCQKRGGNYHRVHLEGQLPSTHPGSGANVLDLTQALEKLETLRPRQARLIKLRYFAGLTLREAADATGVSISTVNNDWASAKSWLRSELADSSSDFY